MLPDAMYPTKFVFHRWEDGSVIATAAAARQEEGGHPYWSMRRSSYQRHLHEAAVEAGVEVRLDARVEGVDERVPNVRLVGGKVLEADLVVLADGKCRIRSQPGTFSHPFLITCLFAPLLKCAASRSLAERI